MGQEGEEFDPRGNPVLCDAGGAGNNTSLDDPWDDNKTNTAPFARAGISPPGRG